MHFKALMTKIFYDCKIILGMINTYVSLFILMQVVSELFSS